MTGLEIVGHILSQPSFRIEIPWILKLVGDMLAASGLVDTMLCSNNQVLFIMLEDQMQIGSADYIHPQANNDHPLCCRQLGPHAVMQMAVGETRMAPE